MLHKFDSLVVREVLEPCLYQTSESYAMVPKEWDRLHDSKKLFKAVTIHSTLCIGGFSRPDVLLYCPGCFITSYEPWLAAEYQEVWQLSSDIRTCNLSYFNSIILSPTLSTNIKK